MRWSVVSLFFAKTTQLPGNRQYGKDGWHLQVQLKLHMWMGVYKDCNDIWKTDGVTSLPSGYQEENNEDNVKNWMNELQPICLNYFGRSLAVL